jgi:hypothetical protein
VGSEGGASPLPWVRVRDGVVAFCASPGALVGRIVCAKGWVGIVIAEYGVSLAKAS